MTKQQQLVSLDYERVKKPPPYSRRAIACFLLAVLCVFALLTPLVVPHSEPLICGSPFAAFFSIAFGSGASAQFPDDRGIMYRGLWMFIVGMTISVLMLIGFGIWFLVTVFHRMT